MTTVVAAALLGLLAGLAAGGRLARVSEHPVRSWSLLVGGALLQVLAQLGPERFGFALVVVSYVALTAFAARNLHLVGMGLVLAAIVLNGALIALNHGMPVRASAAADAGVHELGPAHHLERDSDRLVALADVIPLPPAGEVLSFGDLVLAVGLGNVAARVLHPRPRRSALRPRRGLQNHELGPALTQ